VHDLPQDHHRHEVAEVDAMSTPIRWLATTNSDQGGSPDYERVAVGAKDAFAMLGDAEAIRLQRTYQQTDGPPLRIFVEDATVLLGDAEHGDSMRFLAHILTRHGREFGVRLELQW
jgi:hypothetical protein